MSRNFEGKAGNADHQPNRCFRDAKDIAKQIRGSIRDPGLVEDVPVRCYKYAESNDASYSVERSYSPVAPEIRKK